MKADNGNNKGRSRITSAAEPANEARLGVARKRLAESKDEKDAIEGLREIVANLLGSEEFALFTVNRGIAASKVWWSFGIDLEGYDLLRALGDAGRQRLMRGECHVEPSGSERSGAVEKVEAFVPIRSGNQTVAILAIFRLLPQKIGFDKSDIELFKLLSEEAAQPLFGPNSRSKPVIEQSGITT